MAPKQFLTTWQSSKKINTPELCKAWNGEWHGNGARPFTTRRGTAQDRSLRAVPSLSYLFRQHIAISIRLEYIEEISSDERGPILMLDTAHSVLLALGSNQGDRQANLKTALQYLSKSVTLQRISSLYETDPIGYEDQPRF